MKSPSFSFVHAIVFSTDGATVVAVTDSNRLLVISIKDTNDQKKITGKPMIILAVY